MKTKTQKKLKRVK